MYHPFFAKLYCVALCVALVGCQSKADEDTTSPAPTQTTATSPSAIKSTLPASVASAPVPMTTLNIAAAKSLTAVMPILVADFNQQHPNVNITVTYDAAGKLYEKILSQPGSYDIYLSANQVFTQALANNTQPYARKYGQPFTYTQGQLVLYSTKHPIEATPTSTLDDFSLDHPRFLVAIADPNIAPYGSAAQIWLVNQNLMNTLAPNIGIKTSIDEAFDLTDKGQADFGFVALSQILAKQQTQSLKRYSDGINYAILPRDSYPAITQDGIVLKPSEMSDAFAKYLLTAKAQDIFTDTGYLPVCTNTNLLPACKTAAN